MKFGNCLACIFWHDTLTKGRPEQNRHGSCHRNPPVVTEGEVGFFPRVGADAWCGEYKAEDVAPVEVKAEKP